MAECNPDSPIGAEGSKVPDGDTDIRYRAPGMELVQPRNQQSYSTVMHLFTIYCYISERVPDVYSDIEKELMELLLSASTNAELLNRPDIAHYFIRKAANLLRNVIEPALPTIPVEDDIPIKIVEYLGREDLSDINIELKKQLDLKYSKEIVKLVKHALSSPVQFGDFINIMKVSEAKQNEELGNLKSQVAELCANFKSECQKSERRQKEFQDECEKNRKQLQECQRHRDDLQRKLQLQEELFDREHTERKEKEELLEQERKERKDKEELLERERKERNEKEELLETECKERKEAEELLETERKERKEKEELLETERKERKRKEELLETECKERKKAEELLETERKERKEKEELLKTERKERKEAEELLEREHKARKEAEEELLERKRKDEERKKDGPPSSRLPWIYLACILGGVTIGAVVGGGVGAYVGVSIALCAAGGAGIGGTVGGLCAVGYTTLGLHQKQD